MTAEDQERVRDVAGSDKNWFRLWLKQKAEALFLELGSVKTPLGAFENLLGSY